MASSRPSSPKSQSMVVAHWLRAAMPRAVAPSRNACLTICNGVLAPRRITAQDNLFEIGASSLKLIEMHEQIDRDYPNSVDLTELFDYPTVEALAKHLRASWRSASANGITPAANTRIVP